MECRVLFELISKPVICIFVANKVTCSQTDQWKLWHMDDKNKKLHQLSRPERINTNLHLIASCHWLPVARKNLTFGLNTTEVTATSEVTATCDQNRAVNNWDWRLFSDWHTLLWRYISYLYQVLVSSVCSSLVPMLLFLKKKSCHH